MGLAWREIRRGASTGPLRDFLYTIESDQIDAAQIELGQMDTLDLLATRPSWRMSELAEALRVEPSTATRAVQRLERAGLARRRPSAADGRVVKVEITEAGSEVHRTVVARRSELFAHILGSYSSAELPVFVDLLERFVAAVDEFVASRPN
jgi:DNA-binding MarR family transcriptional regulator